MNYTENYHLPQWVKSDRIMMEDFNDAMSSIEGGLTTGGRAKTQAENICRDAYRQEVQLRLRHGVGGALDAMWVNPLASREDAGGDGHAWNGKYGVWLGEGILPTVEGIRKSAKEVDVIHLGGSENTYRAATTFVSDGYGTMRTVAVWYVEHYNSHEKVFSHTIRLIRLDTGELVKEAGPFVYTYEQILEHQTDFPLEANVTYQLEILATKDTPFSGRIGIEMANSEHYSPSTVVATIGAREAENTITKTVTVPDNAKSALGIIRWMGSGTITLRVGESVGTVMRTRETQNAMGQPCMETELRLENLPVGEAEVELEMERGEEDLQVFDYGLIWQ